MSIYSGKIYVVNQFSGGWDNEWPDAFAILTSNGNLLSIDDVVFYGSNHAIPREIRGGSTSIPASSDNSVIGPIDGYDDGELDGRILRSAGFKNFWFFEIDLDKITPDINEIDFYLFN